MSAQDCETSALCTLEVKPRAGGKDVHDDRTRQRDILRTKRFKQLDEVIVGHVEERCLYLSSLSDHMCDWKDLQQQLIRLTNLPTHCKLFCSKSPVVLPLPALVALRSFRQQVLLPWHP